MQKSPEHNLLSVYTVVRAEHKDIIDFANTNRFDISYNRNREIAPIELKVYLSDPRADRVLSPKLKLMVLNFHGPSTGAFDRFLMTDYGLTFFTNAKERLGSSDPYLYNMGVQLYQQEPIIILPLRKDPS